MGNKIATQLIDPVTGERYYIGTVGVVENVAVKLSAPTSEDWASMKVVVQNITQATSEEYALSALGECKFTIPMGNVYSIVYPVLSNYKQPINATFTATLASRSIEYTYSNEEVMYEQINISAHVLKGDIAELNGKVVSALSDNGNAYAAEFANGKVTLRIPYGERYKITLPELDGFLHDGVNIQATAGIPSRFISICYSDGLMGFFGIDNDGNQYTIEKIEQMVADGEDTSVIRYIGYNDSVLSTADRGDGSVGCGFILGIPYQPYMADIINTREQLDINQLPIISPDYRSSYNTATINKICQEKGYVSEAVTYCLNKTITIGGVERRGFLLAANIYEAMYLNKISLDYICELLNVPKFLEESLYRSSSQGNLVGSWKCFYKEGRIQPVYSGTKYNIIVGYDL